MIRLSAGIFGVGALALLGAPLALTRLRERRSYRDLAAGGQYLQLPAGEVYFTDDGPRSGPVIVLLHGFASSIFTWRAQRQALLEAGYRVIAIDQLGYGAAARPAAPVYSTAEHVAGTLAVLDSLGLEAVHLAGHSYGGRIALMLAATAPARVRSLIVLAPEAFATDRPPIARLVRLPLIGQALSYYTLAPRLVRFGLGLIAGSKNWIDDQVVAGYAAPLAVRGTVMAQVWQARSPKDGPRAVPDLLPLVRVPTLLIWGATDAVFPVADGYRLATILPDVELKILANVGHMPHEEAPAEVTQAMLGFLVRK